jgi:hypothetical protein
VKLIEAFHRTKWLASILNTTEQVNKHINVYQKWYQPKNQKQIYCFYAVPRGEEPKESNAGKDWFKEINLAEDLLNLKKKNTQLYILVVTLKKIYHQLVKQKNEMLHPQMQTPIWKIVA